jgi:DnaJ family protein C protein 7
MDSAIKHLQQALRSDPDNTKIRDEYRRIREIEQTKEQGNTAFKENRYQVRPFVSLSQRDR